MDFAIFHEAILVIIVVKVFLLAKCLSPQSSHTLNKGSLNKKYFFAIYAATCSSIFETEMKFPTQPQFTAAYAMKLLE